MHFNTQFYYKVGQVLLQTGAAFLQIGKIRKGYKLGKVLPNWAIMTKQGGKNQPGDWQFYFENSWEAELLLQLYITKKALQHHHSSICITCKLGKGWEN